MITLPPEDDHGCIEYKWSLTSCKTVDKKERLSTQMLWRISQNENENSALYVLGVHDNGFCEGLVWKDMINSILILMDCAISVRLGLAIRKIKRLNNQKTWCIIQIYISGPRINKSKDDTFIKIPDHSLPDFLQI